MPLADGWHPYFKLGESIDDCLLQFNSETMVQFDESLIPTGKKLIDRRFYRSCLIKDIQLDNCFELNNYEDQPRCFLSKSNITLAIEPDASYPYLQVYTPPHRKSIAIENLSGAPDAFNNGMGLIILHPQEKKVFKTAYQILNN